jgi:CO dehydrogenase/acetyl-CoA synthase alpha subunit
MAMAVQQSVARLRDCSSWSLFGQCRLRQRGNGWCNSSTSRPKRGHRSGALFLACYRATAASASHDRPILETLQSRGGDVNLAIGEAETDCFTASDFLSSRFSGLIFTCKWRI